jgi:predicted RNase H-like HicB family nuclease
VHRKEVVALIYRVDIARDESGAWLARVPAVPGCHTYGRTLEQARRRIREALGLWVEGADRAQLEFRIRLPSGVRAELERARSARERSAQAQLQAHEATVRAAKDLTERLGLSLRDASELLDLSHQRVQQLVSG